MADGVGTSNLSAINFIDLTLSDDDSPSPPAIASIQTSSRPSIADEVDGTLPQHGLLLDRAFSISTGWLPGLPEYLTPSVQQKASPLLSRAKLSTLHNAGTTRSTTKPRPAYLAVDAKRRRVDDAYLEPNSEAISDLDIAKPKTTTSSENIPPPADHTLLPSSRTQSFVASSNLVQEIEPHMPHTKIPNPSSHSVQQHKAPVHRTQASTSSLDLVQEIKATQLRVTGSAAHEDAMNESLKLALRQQVFPHINQCLGHYRRSIDRVTCKRLGKKVAWKLCGKEFMDDLIKNDGRLSSLFESKIAAMARSLVDQLAEDFLSNSRKAKVQSIKVTSHHRDEESSPKRTTEPACETQLNTGSTLNLETTKPIGNLRSSAMKARWDRGDMDAVVTARIQNARKRAEEQLSQPTLAPGEKGNPPELQPTAAPTICLDDSNSSEEEAIRKPWSVSVPRIHRGKFQRHHLSTKTSSRADPAVRPSKVVILKYATCTTLDGARQQHGVQNAVPVRRSQSQSTSQKKKAMHSRRTATAQDRLGFISSAKSVAAIREIEVLRLAGLDDRVSRPYLASQDRRDISRGLAIINLTDEFQAYFSEAEVSVLLGFVLHVDFSQEELKQLLRVIESTVGASQSLGSSDLSTYIERLMNGQESIIPKVASSLDHATAPLLQSRTNETVMAFLKDAAIGRVSKEAQIIRLESTAGPSQGGIETPDSVNEILRKREVWGRHRDSQDSRSIKSRLNCLLEDKFTREAEWTDCSGDIASISWIDSERFVCGATAHSDEHNMQYNKPGNLLVGSCNGKIMRSIAGHQVVRPMVTSGENSSAAMRGTQDPWMYCSVTSIAYSHDNKKCFTGSYDQTVKVWDIVDDGSLMELCGTWDHSGNVNLVVASRHHSLVATAADVCENAIRLYEFNPCDISANEYRSFEPSLQGKNRNDTWAYFPATMQWGLSTLVSHLLLVGYSPRSFNCHDSEIPEERLNTGELCLWDVKTGNQIPIASAWTQNVFEVAWHPSQAMFVAATSPTGTFEDGVKTQIRIFGPTASGSFSYLKTLDCPALDINEITIMPNSVSNCYVTASCTNGKTYVWDSALSDAKPTHTLCHSESIDDQVNENSREEADSGVKFAAWGKTSDRFYTGSSDGVVKAWNIRAIPGKEFVRDVVVLSGGVSAGRFSSDFSRLVIGDATGKIHLLSSVENEGSKGLSYIRKPITPHASLEHPLIDKDDQIILPPQTGLGSAQQFLSRKQLKLHNDEYVGAIQDLNYSQTGLFYNAEKYKIKGQDSKGWSYQELEKKRQKRYEAEEIYFPQLPELESSDQSLHDQNLALDFDIATMPSETIVQLLEDRVDMHFQDENEFCYEFECKIKLDNDNDSFLVKESFLEEAEIQNLQQLEKEILQKLVIQKQLQDLLLDL